MKAGADLFGGNVIGMDAWETHQVGAVTVTAMPALHGPPGSESRTGPVIGFLLEADGEPSVYVSGDNASVPLVEQIAERFAPVGIAILFAGAARIAAVDAPLTLRSEDAAVAARVLGANRVVGLHTEDWTHFSETRQDLTEAFDAAGLGHLLVDVPRGVRVEL
jgi:L-ascorbate metabolism protein UlaG (beta-lactamase superfamily)